jgi:hypothetical protein
MVSFTQIAQVVKEELRKICARFELDIDDIVRHNVETQSIDTKVSDISAEVGTLGSAPGAHRDGDQRSGINC